MPEQDADRRSAAADTAGGGVGRKRVLVEAFLALLLLVPVIWLALSPHSPPPAPAAKDSPSDVSTLLASSTELLLAGRHEESLAVARQALVADPKSADAHNNIGVACLKLGRWDEALSHVNEAIRLRPDFQLAKNNVAWIQSERAKAEAAAGTQPAAAGVEKLLAESIAHYQAERWQACIDTARKALALDPNLPTAYNNISAASNQLGLWDEGIRNAQEAIRLQPDFQLARNNLAAAEAAKHASGASSR